MDNRQIPKTDLTVSTICLGTMTFGTPVEESEAIKITQWALDNGVNFIDTANIYQGYTRSLGSAGEVAENILGKALQGRRDNAVLATKVGMKVGGTPEDECTSPAAIRKQLDKSLKRLDTDFVDIYYLHKPDPDTPLADTIGALNEAIEQGKIRHYGISNYSAEQTAELINVADANNLPRPVIHQPPYSLLKPDVQKDLLPLCEREQIAATPYQVLEGGLLTGKYHRGETPTPGSRRDEKPQWMPDLDDQLFDNLELIEAQAREKGETMLAYTLKETLAKPAVVSLVLGVKRIDQLESLIAVVG